MDAVPVTPTIEDVQLQTVDELPRGLSALLRELHDVAARSIQTTLREWARAPVGVEVANELQAPYSEFTRSLEIPVAIASLESSALSGAFVVCMDGPMSSAVTDLLLGGSIRPSTDRWPTATDSLIRQRGIEEFAAAIHESFRPLLDLDPKVARFESTPNFIFDVAPDDPVIAYTLAVTLDGDQVGAISVIYPFASLRPLLDQVPASAEETERSAAPTSVQLEDVEVELRAMVGPTTVPVGDFLSLEPGDVLVLDQWADQPTIGMVNGTPLLELTVGSSSGHVAAVVEGWKE